MKLRDLIFAPTPKADVPTAAPATFPIPTHTEWMSWFGTGTMSASAAMSVPGVFRCNTLVQDLSAQIELTEERRIITDTGQVRWETVANKAPIIRRPDLYTPTETWTSQVCGALGADGEAFLVLGSVDPSTGRPTTATLTPAAEWTVAYDDNGLRPVYRWRGRVMTPWVDMIHVPYLTVPGRLRGMGPVQAYAKTLTASQKLEDWAATLFDEGGLASVYLSSEFDVDDIEAEEMQARWIERHGDKLTPAVLSNGLTAENASLDPDTAQALESRMWAVQSAASVYGFNPYMLAVAMSGANITYQTLPDLFSEAIRLVIYPNYLRKVETALTELLPRGRRAMFNLSEFLRADEQTRVKIGVDGTGAGLFTVNEWRGREGLPPIEGEPANEVPETSTD